MQKLERDGVYAAEWGGYVVKLTLVSGIARAHLLRDGADGVAAESPADAGSSAGEAMTWAAERLQRLGRGDVFVDGERRPLVDFLAFKWVAAR